MPMITAHSGCENTPADSMDSLRLAAELGAGAAEVDVRADQDGVLRLSHDRKETQAEYARCVPLEQAVSFAAEWALSLNFDIKEPWVLRDALALAKRHGIPRERLWVSGGITPEQLARDPALTASARFYLNIEEIFKYLFLQERGQEALADFAGLMTDPWRYTAGWMENLPARAEAVKRIWRASGAEGLNLPYWHVNAAALAAFAGVPLSIWTVDSEADARRLLRAPVRNIVNLTTRRVLQAQRIRREFSPAEEDASPGFRKELPK